MTRARRSSSDRHRIVNAGLFRALYGRVSNWSGPIPKFVPLRRILWQRFCVAGLVVTEDSARAAAGLRVTEFGKDRLTDIDLCIFASGHSIPIADTACEIQENASEEEYFRIEVPKGALARSSDRT